MNEEVVTVLKMVEEGKISVDKAKEIIEALESSSKNTDIVPAKLYDDKFFRVNILSNEGDRVNIQLPIKVIKEVIKLTGKLPISTSIEGMEGIDIDEIMNTIVSCLDNEVMGDIVDISSSQGDIVKIGIS
ncbi:hypothetical protein SAMN02745196_02668 [Clostridium collagenovorans DSM 3089]|uniref:YvlB/LiaX N-terminal domain-containing protein n=1 Tax=Clostridium collagenovorans DSM 3089 TaxID=1121306 RepID=A0A1M5Y4W0_9CLOT|nr:hypothetical protein [Clostridium collagenovorans]SHI07135.1 hypothetical protein SAMN02745196_02668 [Clostridium collagenovorans DSM 3089]